MEIAFFGSSLVSAYWNGAATYYRGLIRALHGLGHRVTFYEPDAFERQQHRDLEDPDWATVVVYPADAAGAGRALERAASADVVVKASGVGVLDDLLEAAVAELSAPSRLAIYWDVDAPATLDRLERRPDDPLWLLLPRFDLVLTYGGGPPVVAAFEALGARRCVPIYNALDQTTHHPVGPDERFEADLAFLGNRLPDREARVRAYFLQTAEALPGRRFLLGGAGWGDVALPANVRSLGHVFTADHNAFNCTPLAVLNINRESMARIGYSPATRVFEAAGAGACLISDSWPGLELFLEPGREVLAVDQPAGVAAALDALDPQLARQIGQAALRRVRAEHTYEHRALQLTALLEGLER